MVKKGRKRGRASPRIPTQILERLPENHLLLYAHLWEFETWLREMVYVELVARYGSGWKFKLEGNTVWPQERDRRLRHMPTREMLSTSYISFSQLCRTISKRWVLFRGYLPPKDIWSARVGEVEQIRNRVAHFRRGHRDDIKRVQQLLLDIDEGFWKFCTSYNDSRPIISGKVDPIVREFAALDPFPWTEVETGKFARVGGAPRDLVMAVTIEALRRPWLKARRTSSIDGRYGYLYNVVIVARQNRCFDYEQFLESTKHLHGMLCHICLDALRDSIRVTVPALLGSTEILPLLNCLVREARSALQPSSASRFTSKMIADVAAASHAVDKLAWRWPEHVLGPGNPLTFLGPGMPCHFFGQS